MWVAIDFRGRILGRGPKMIENHCTRGEIDFPQYQRKNHRIGLFNFVGEFNFEAMHVCD